MRHSHKRGILKTRVGLYLLAVAVLLASGCAGPLKVEYGPTSGKDGLRAPATGSPVTFMVERFVDGRGDSPPSENGSRTVGMIDSVVTDMRSGPLTLADDIEDIVTTAFSRELSDAGFMVVSGEGVDTDYVMSGEVRRFRLDIKERDRIAIEVAARVERTDTGEAVWSGSGAFEDDRYAGVFGNSRKTISEYVSAGLGRAMAGMLADATRAVGSDLSRKAAPPSAPPALVPSATSPEPVEAAPRPPAAAPMAPAPAVPAAPAAPAEQTGYGVLAITTDPPSAKVYLDGIYYGLTPITIDMEPGVYDLRLKRAGYNDESERVSVRPAQKTEMEVEFVER